jgi:hypothetical protein
VLVELFKELERNSYSPIMTICIKGVEIIRTANIEENTKEKIYGKLNEITVLTYI